MNESLERKFEVVEPELGEVEDDEVLLMVRSMAKRASELQRARQNLERQLRYQSDLPRVRDDFSDK